MAFNPARLNLVLEPIGGDGLRWFNYLTDDDQATVLGTAYFEDVRRHSLRLYDLVFVSPEDAAIDPYIVVIDSIDDDGNGTAVIGGANGDLKAENNLSDLQDAAIARANLGLGTASVEDIGTEGEAVPLLSNANTFGATQRIDTGASARLDLNKQDESVSEIVALNDDIVRWKMRVANEDAESGSNAGSNFAILRHGDTGTLLGEPLSIDRSTGVVSMLEGATLGEESSGVVTIKGSAVTAYAASLLTSANSAAFKSALAIAGGINYREGGWVTATAYAEGDWLSYNGVAYICKDAHTSDAASEPGDGVDWNDYWDQDPFGTATVLDEDDFATDSQTSAPSQQSTRVYIESALQVATGYDTIAEFEAATIDEDIDVVAVKGYYAPGDTESDIILERTTELPPGMNILRASNKFTASPWGTSTLLSVSKAGSRVLQADDPIDKFGWFLIPTTSNTTHGPTNTVNYVSGQDYVFAGKFRSNGGYGRIQFVFPAGGFGTVKTASFNVAAGSLIAADAGVTYGMEDLGGGWRRCWAIATATATAAAGWSFQILNDSNAATFAGNGTSGILAAEMQCDPSSVLTAYVKTAGDRHLRRAVEGYYSDAGGGRWRLNINQQLTSKKFGLKHDGVDTGVAFTGSDDREKWADVLAFGARYARPVWLSAGPTRQLSTEQDSLIGYNVYSGYNYVDVRGFGPNSIVLLDEDLTYYTNAGGHNARGWCTGTSMADYDREEWAYHNYQDFTFQGRGHHGNAAGGPGRYGTFPIWTENVKEMHTKRVRFFDIRQGCVQAKYGMRYVADLCHAERIGAGNIACPLEYSNVNITRNYCIDTDDDPIGASTGGTALNPLYPTRSQVIIEGNILVSTTRLLCWGFRNGRVANNVIVRSHGVPIMVGYTNEQVGRGAADNIIVDGNIILDALGRYDSGEWFASETGCILIAGSDATGTGAANSVIPGRYNSTLARFSDTWDTSGTIPLWGAENAGPPTTIASPGGQRVIVSNNVIARTLPPASSYTQWGFGRYWNGFEGYLNPTVTNANFRNTGIHLWAGSRNVLIHSNIIAGFETAGIEFQVTGTWTDSRKNAFWNVVISNNIIEKCGRGIHKDNASAGGTMPTDYDDWGLVVRDNLFNLDPLHKLSIRKAGTPNGTWVTDSTTLGRAINIMRLRGVTIDNNVFMNCWGAFAYGRPSFYEHGTFRNNLCIGKPAAEGFSTSNGGIAFVERCGEGITWRIHETNPTVSDYPNMLNALISEANGKPAAGTYVAGHFVRNANPSISGGKVLMGWLRLTTGTAHTANTDWVSLFMTNT